MIITQATLEDELGILALLKANHVSNVVDKTDGFVTTNMTNQQLAALITKENGVTIAKENEKVLAFAMAASWDFWSEWPFFAYMIEQLPIFSFVNQPLTTENSYQYGPICVDKSVRGSGLFEQVFYASLSSMKNRFPLMVTFINQVNPRSFAAHTKKVPMTLSGTFQFNQNDYYLMACPTDLK
ncbi:GNAT family acetyltransferase [Eubacteriales bacterium OttesenSCG-928-K08]|nr:GNAT family acetyltransferase [Eubacteriales bacterium OttesenSCG-928-K08]